MVGQQQVLLLLGSAPPLPRAVRKSIFLITFSVPLAVLLEVFLLQLLALSILLQFLRSFYALPISKNVTWQRDQISISIRPSGFLDARFPPPLDFCPRRVDSTQYSALSTASVV